MKNYSFLQEQFNPLIINEGALRDLFRFHTMCNRAEVYRETMQNKWVAQLKELIRKFKNGEISKEEYEAKKNFIHNLMAQLELKLSNLNLLPRYG